MVFRQIAEYPVAVLTVLAFWPMQRIRAGLAWLDRRLFGRWAWGRAHRGFVLNVIAGTLITLALMPLHDSRWLVGVADASFDALNRMNFGQELPESGGVRAPPMAWIDIDQETHQAWNELLHTPRDRLAELLAAVVFAGPPVVIVDVDVDMASADAAADQQLRRWLAEYLQTCKGAVATPCPVIVLAKGSRTVAGSMDGLWRESRIAGLDALVRTAAREPIPRLRWAAAEQELSEDGVIRRWVPWRCVRGMDGAPLALPSFQLAAAAAIADLEAGHDGTSERVSARLGALCRGGDDPADASTAPFRVGPWAWRADNSREGRYVFYTSTYQEDEDALLTPLRRVGGRREALILRISALQLLAAGEAFDRRAIRDRVAIIGTSHDDSTDEHRTPLGMMPGALVVANTIASFTAFGEARLAPLWLRVLLSVLMILVASWILWQVRGFWGGRLAALTVLLGLSSFSLVLFRQGLWLDFAIPLLVVQLYDLRGMLAAEPRAGGDEAGGRPA